jgi:hypothetical protein
MGERGCALSEAVGRPFEGFRCRRADISRVAITRRPKGRVPTAFILRVRWCILGVGPKFGKFATHPARGHFQSFQPRFLRPEKAAAAFKRVDLPLPESYESVNSRSFNP